MKKLILVLCALFSIHGYGQTHTFPALDTNNNFTGQNAFISLNGELNAALYVSPELAVAAACAVGGGRAVYLPAGSYSSAGIPACNYLHLRCAASDTLGQGGAVINLTGANWGLYNPNADLTSGSIASNEVHDMVVQDCTWNLSSNSSALGALRIKGIRFSEFRGIKVFTNNNPNPAITEDGANFSHNGGDYDNNFYGPSLYDNSSSSTGTGFLIQDGNGGTACSNNNQHFGASVARFGVSIQITCGNNNLFSGGDGEDFTSICVDLSSNGGGGQANDNKIDGFRCEYAGTPSASVYGSNADVHTYNNNIHIYASGSFNFARDLSGKNTYPIDTLYGPYNGSSGSTVYHTAVFSNKFQNTTLGINQLPAMTGGNFGGIDIGGAGSTLLQVEGNTVLNGIITEVNSGGSATNLYKTGGAFCNFYKNEDATIQYYNVCVGATSWSVFDNTNLATTLALFSSGTTQLSSGKTSASVNLFGNSITWAPFGGSTVGTLNNDGSVNIDIASGNSIKLTGTPTGVRVATFPDATGNVVLDTATQTLTNKTLSATTLALTASGTTVTTAGTAVTNGTCQAQTGVTITGVTTASVVAWSIPTALPATWQTGITVVPVVTANTVTLNLCNPTAGSITPAAQAVNVRVIQ